MDSLTASLLTFFCCFVGYAAGQWLSRFLPEHHYQQSDARDVLKSATGMIATLVALVLGLLLSRLSGGGPGSGMDLGQPD